MLPRRDLLKSIALGLTAPLATIRDARRRQEAAQRVRPQSGGIRARVYRLTHGTILEMLNAFRLRRDADAFCVPVWDGLPPDCRITAVDYAPEWRGWRVIVEHESFELVPDGQEIPMTREREAGPLGLAGEYRAVSLEMCELPIHVRKEIESP